MTSAELKDLFKKKIYSSRVQWEACKKKAGEFFKKKQALIQISMTNFSEKLDQKMPSALEMYGEEWSSGNPPKRYLHWILWSIILFFFIFILWAKFASLDELTIAEGKVIPSTQVQIIQNLEGGIIKSLYVKEGDLVKKNQLLIQLEPTRFKSAYQEGLLKDIALELKIARLTAESELKPFHPPLSLTRNDPDLYQQQQALYLARHLQLMQLQQSKQLAQSEVDMTAPLVKEGAASAIEVLRLKGTVSDLQEKIDNYNSDTLNQLTQARADLSALKEANLGYYDRLQRTAIRSPVRGIIKQIKVTTIGGVSQPGMDLMEIVPLDDTLLIEAKVKPIDIGFLRPGLEATVKIGAYDYSIYGGLKGKVEEISADSIIDDKDQHQQSYYLIRVRTQKNYLGTPSKPLYIIPGMTATVDILTGHKTVLNYLLKPLLKARERALRER